MEPFGQDLQLSWLSGSRMNNETIKLWNGTYGTFAVHAKTTSPEGPPGAAPATTQIHPRIRQQYEEWMLNGEKLLEELKGGALPCLPLT